MDLHDRGWVMARRRSRSQGAIFVGCDRACDERLANAKCLF